MCLCGAIFKRAIIRAGGIARNLRRELAHSSNLPQRLKAIYFIKLTYFDKKI